MNALVPGQRVGAYALEACVGEGGMGAVYRARDTSLGRVVALKVIRRAADEGPSADAIARFLREARLGASLSHPNIVVVYEAGAFGDMPYLAMEWVDGRSLAALTADATCTLAQRMEILGAMADALAYAHAHGVIHRDVKPSNVMVDARGRARLVDFGIAKRTANFAPGTMMLPTHARQLLGTPAYMAPEQMLSAAVDGRADQFAWGVMAYELLGGAHPNATVPEDGSPFPVAKPRPLHWVRPDVPEAVAAIVHRALSYEPDGRFGSMDELLAAWRAARTTPASASAATGSYAPTGYASTPPTAPMHGAITAPPAPMPYALHARPHAPRRLPWIAAVVVLGVLLVASGVGIAVVMTAGAAETSALGPKKASLESFEDLKFAPPQPDLVKTKAIVESKVTPCFAASSVAKEQMFKVTIDVTADGRVTKVSGLEVCKEQHPSFYLCTEREKRPPKKGYPTVPDDVFACIERALLATRLPRVVVAAGQQTSSGDLDIHVQ